jgi:hypothetical protein
VTGSDLLSALGPVVDVLEGLGVRYYVGGSVASSAHGVPRASLDADVVADLGFDHVRPFVERLRDAYYVDEGRVHAAVEARRSFNLIHLATMFKIDVFASKRRAFDHEAQARARPQALDDAAEARRFLVASPEDTILAKLEWFRAGGEVSERQWADIVGVARVRQSQTDWEYLKRWAQVLGVRDLLDRVRAEISEEDR